MMTVKDSVEGIYHQLNVRKPKIEVSLNTDNEIQDVVSRIKYINSCLALCINSKSGQIGRCTVT